MNLETVDQFLALLFIIGVILFLIGILPTILNAIKPKETVVGTPVTEEGLIAFDDLPPGMAVALAWSEPGEHPEWHRQMQRDVRTKMPVLARALDRMVEN